MAQEIVYVTATGAQAFTIVGNVQDFAMTYGNVEVAVRDRLVLKLGATFADNELYAQTFSFVPT